MIGPMVERSRRCSTWSRPGDMPGQFRWVEDLR
jgi:hypothetical protein